MTHQPLSRRQLVTAGGGLLASAALPRMGRAQGAPVTLTIANSQWLDALRGKTLWNALLQYQSVAPHVKLEQEAIPSAEIDKKLTTEFGGGQGPDIAIMQEGLFYTIADAGFLADAGKSVAGVGNLNLTNANGLVGGKRLGVAWQRAVYALIYDKPLLDAGKATVPTDIDELITASRAITAATGAIGLAARHQMADFSGWFMDFQCWAYGYGVNWVDPMGKLTIDTPEAVAAVAAFNKVYAAKIIPIGDDMPTQRTRFKEKRIAFSIDNSGGTLNIASGGALSASDLYAAPLPFKHPGAHQQLFVGVNAASKNVAAAMDFLAWMVSPPGQQVLRNASGPDALATDVPLTEAFRAANPWADVFNTLAKTSRSTLIPGHEVDTAGIMRPVMEGLERVMISGADPKAAMAEAQRQVDRKF